MRTITCAHLIADADAPPATAQQIQIADGRVTAVGPAPAGAVAAVVALSRSALGGVGTVMMHYTRAQGFSDLPTEVVEVARAARAVGVRVGFAVSMKDRNPLVYGPS